MIASTGVNLFDGSSRNPAGGESSPPAHVETIATIW